MTVGQWRLTQVWRQMKSLSANCGSGSEPQTAPEKCHHADPGWTAMASGHLPKKDIFTGRDKMVSYAASAYRVPHSQSCRSTIFPGHGRNHVSQMTEAWLQAKLSLYHLHAANVPAMIMDSGQIGFLYCAGPINSTQYHPPVSPKCVPTIFHQHNWHQLYCEHKPANRNRNNCILLENVWGWLLCFRTGGSLSEKLWRLK